MSRLPKDEWIATPSCVDYRYRPCHKSLEGISYKEIDVEGIQRTGLVVE